MPDPSLVIVGSLEDAHARAIYDGLKERGQDPFVLDAQCFPEDLPISLGDRVTEMRVGGRELGRPAAAYVRSLYQNPAGFGVDADEAMQENWRRTMLAFRERSTLLAAILLRWELAGTALYNPSTSGIKITKPYQLALLEAADLPVPASLWSNDPEAVKRFCSKYEAIYKPVAGGASTKKVTPRDLEPERLARLQSAPVCFQELLPGDDIRVYVIDGRIICALRIVTDEIDFRQNEQAIESIELSAEVQAQCIRAAEVIGLRYTGMDIKGDREGRYKILELNPSAMFLGFEQRAGVDIKGPLCEAMISHV